ncbi:YcnI family protein [Streptomyces sp. ACA25]|uniref:YcnI family copper-binding membrane protein n=1 Tax=Streptomyces sp. ACA25 TaxID=3022596 RepID=UPI0023073D79|nr:YcnI family protein [Streptomyces sp. ACA25]MDB1086184.1 YcnI family protein [Streptomyces sp. ACA25]
MNRNRLLAATAVATAAVLALGTPALAHVTIDPRETTAGGYSTVNVKVPNERDDASTVEVEVFLDPEYPVASVMPQPVPGWDVEVETAELDEPLEVHGNRITEAPSKITWSGGEIGPGMFQQFPVSMGRLPEDADRMVFKAIQTYDSGEVVRWIDEPGEDAEQPAAVLTLTPGDDGHGHDDADAAAADTDADEAPAGDHGETATEATGSAGSAGSSDTTARVLGGVGILVGAAGVAFGVLAGRRRTSA